MQLLTEILRNENATTVGKTIQREAVRGIVLRGRNLLMVYSPVNGDYKFPGGGVNDGESHYQALRREIREECGGTVVNIGQGVGKIYEFDIPQEPEYDVFKMTSYYYPCQIEEAFGEQKLDAYEKELDFRSLWIDIDEAIQSNQTILNSRGRKIPEWTKRDTFMLGYIKEYLLNP